MLLERANPADPNTQLLEKIERQTFRAAKNRREPAEPGPAVRRAKSARST